MKTHIMLQLEEEVKEQFKQAIAEKHPHRSMSGIIKDFIMQYIKEEK